MMKNCQHNLIHQLSETMDSLWRMDQYVKDAEMENCQGGADFWRNFKKTLEEQVKLLKEQLEKVVKEEGLDINR
ncbi:hypothetical protein J7K86_02290 [bacterium]|nr:hypothetical protein [bacterium]